MTGAAQFTSASEDSVDDSVMSTLATLTRNSGLLSQAATDSALRSALLECESALLTRPLRHSLLSDRAILTGLLLGSIVIQPFNLSHLSTSSYDVTLGPHYYREAAPEPGCALYNPYCADMVRRVWGEARQAERHSAYIQRAEQPPLRGIAAEDLLIWIAPGETILAHTSEYIGGRGSVTTMMKARSSMGRNFIEVCKVTPQPPTRTHCHLACTRTDRLMCCRAVRCCGVQCAGWGDIGYTNRWTMEVTNNSRYYSIPLVVGRRIAQIVFLDSDGVLEGEGGTTSYERAGKYQTSSDMEALTRSWQPSDMLPRLYADRECIAATSYSGRESRPTREKTQAVREEIEAHTHNGEYLSQQLTATQQ